MSENPNFTHTLMTAKIYRTIKWSH